MRLRPASLRFKILIVIVTSVVIAVLTCGLIVRQAAARAEDNRMRDNISSQLREASSIYSETGVLTLNAAVDDPTLPEPAKEAALNGQSVTMRSEIDNTEVVWAAAPIMVGSHTAVISVRTTTAESRELVGDIDRAILISMLVSAVVIGGIGFVVAGQISRRLTLGAHAARRIASGDTTVRISDMVEHGDDEVTAFAEAVDTAVERLAERLDSEQRFTADLAHEMRTPLTGLVNAANLLEEDSRPAELVRERTERLQTLVEDLLEVSRLDSGSTTPDFETVNINHMLKSLLLNLRSSGLIVDHEIQEVYADPSPQITTDPRRFERIVSNLIANSIKHGADPIRIETTPHSVVVTDSGPGYPADIIAKGPTRFVSSGGGGMGLGLVIAQGQAKLLGMRMEFRNAPEGGAQAEVVFPE